MSPFKGRVDITIKMGKLFRLTAPLDDVAPFYIPAIKGTLSRQFTHLTRLVRTQAPSDHPRTSFQSLRLSGFFSQRRISALILNFVDDSLYHRDIAESQSRLARDRESLDRAIDKLTVFTELVESLSGVSKVGATAVKATLDGIARSRHELEKIFEDDTRRLSELWNDALDIFLRGVCRQFDIELEAGTVFLRHEAKILLESFPKSSAVSRPGRPVPIPDNSLRRAAESTSNRVCADGHAVVADRSTFNMEDDTSVNPPIGSSDNGWGCKRRRVASDDQKYTEAYSETKYSSMSGDVLGKMQQQLDDQCKQINALMARNEVLEKAVQVHSVHVGDGGPQMPRAGIIGHEDFVAMGQRVKCEILASISPTLEDFKRVNERVEGRLDTLMDDMNRLYRNRTFSTDHSIGSQPSRASGRYERKSRPEGQTTSTPSSRTRMP
ncbi:hypothetical protein BU17DRAFT_100606 [Hysterangium stoloniferum]|nr:hypothetical protein BU17DRAFT_100606 [Hysterangium stoloniferum]